MVILEHPASIVGRMLYSLHLHLQSPPILAATVARGEELSPGATGHATGCLRHLEVPVLSRSGHHLWENIYGPRDQRTARHFREHWGDPVTFIARLEGHDQQDRGQGDTAERSRSASGISNRSVAEERAEQASLPPRGHARSSA